MKSIIKSAQPKVCERIMSGEQTIIIAKSAPKGTPTPFRVYIYQTKKPVAVLFNGTGKHISEYDKTYCYNERSGKVIGEFICDRIVNIKPNSDDCGNYWHEWTDECDIEDMCLSYNELEEYLGKNIGYGWHISELKIYDKPKELRDFGKKIDSFKRYSSELGMCSYECGECEYFDYPDNPIYEAGECCADRLNNGVCPLTRAPRSWQYVEEM